MDFETHYITPDIKLSSYDDRLFKADLMFSEHLLVWFISGETKIIMADATYTFGAGDIFLIPRHQPATAVNYPKDGLPHKSVAMHLTTERLRNYYAGIEVKANAVVQSGIRRYHGHPLLQSCLVSLVPYFELKDTFPENIASLKIAEAISVLRVIDQEIDGVLANFEPPGKISLEKFMEQNYMFNMPLERFGYLTGRSLSSFNRDFRQQYQTSPQKWLTRKRLELAHFQLTDQHKRPNEIYLEVGFENLSHFSFAFKKHFGYAPNTLIT